MQDKSTTNEGVRVKAFFVTAVERDPGSSSEVRGSFATKRELLDWLRIQSKQGVGKVRIENSRMADTFYLNTNRDFDEWYPVFQSQTETWPIAYIARDNINMDDLMENVLDALQRELPVRRGFVTSILGLQQQFRNYGRPLTLEDAIEIMGVPKNTTWDAVYGRLKRIMGGEFVIVFDGAAPMIVPAKKGRKQ